jgi:hypothetical protein
MAKFNSADFVLSSEESDNEGNEEDNEDCGGERDPPFGDDAMARQGTLYTASLCLQLWP